jgi:CelD/BcsL family acetyltransferase involved in cellulose biosynthesis
MNQLQLSANTTRSLPTVTSQPRIEVVRCMDGLEAIKAEWQALYARVPWGSPMLHDAWTRSFATASGLDGALQVMVAGNARSKAIAPLFRRHGGTPRLELIGAEELHEVVDFLYEQPADLVPLAAAIARAGLPLVIKRIRTDSPTIAVLEKAYRGRGIVIRRPARDCPWIALDASWKDPERHLNSGRRSDLRRARRHAEEKGNLDWEILAPDPTLLQSLLDQVYEVEASGWKGAEGTALKFNTVQGAFYRHFATIACEQGILRLCFLRIDGRVAAAQIAVEVDGRFWLLKIGYSNEFARCSPGLLLMVETIRYAAGAGLRAYEFLGAVEPWIGNWTQLRHPCISLRAYPMSVRGMVGLAVDATRAIGRKTRSFHPHSKRAGR